MPVQMAGVERETPDEVGEDLTNEDMVFGKGAIRRSGIDAMVDESAAKSSREGEVGCHQTASPLKGRES